MLRLPRTGLAVVALALGLAATAGAAPTYPQTAVESRNFQAILDRLQSPENAALLPVPVTETVKSLTQTVTKTFSERAGNRSVHVTIRIRTRPIHWDPTYMGDAEWQGASKVVGRYRWHIETRTRGTRSSREITLTATNTLMLDDQHMAEGEQDTLGRIADESLLYHELLHGQLLINAMDDPAWRKRLMATNEVDTSGSDSSHRWIYDLQARYLLGRGGQYAYTVPAPGSSGNVPGSAPGSATGAFSIVIGRTPSSYVGAVTGEFRTLVQGNVDNLKVQVGKRGDDRGRVTLSGTLKDTRRGGFFLAVIDPVIRNSDPPPSGPGAN